MPPLPFMGCAGLTTMPDPIVLSAIWEDAIISYPSIEDATNDPTLTFRVGATRKIYAIKSGAAGTLYYRINAGSWTSYIVGAGAGALLTINSGDTLGWKFGYNAGNISESCTVMDDARGEQIDILVLKRVGA